MLKRIEAELELPPEVTVLDAGTPGLDLTLFIEGSQSLIVVDAVKARGSPGKIRTYGKADLLQRRHRFLHSERARRYRAADGHIRSILQVADHSRSDGDQGNRGPNGKNKTPSPAGALHAGGA